MSRCSQATNPITMNQTRFEQMIQWAAWRPLILIHQHGNHFYCFQESLNSFVVIQIIQLLYILDPVTECPAFLTCCNS